MMDIYWYIGLAMALGITVLAAAGLTLLLLAILDWLEGW